MILMYLRKSRADDNTMSVDEVLEKHQTILQEYAINTFGAPIPESQIIKEVVSGETIADRPGIRKVLELITNNDIEGVLVVEPQRLSRGDLVDCGTIIRCFKYSDTKIITPQKTFDLTDRYDEKFLTMTLQQGNDYLEYIKMIMERGRLQAIKSGQYIYNVAPYGYDRVKVDGKRTLTPNDNAPVVQYIFDLAKAGNAPYKIARELDRQGIKPCSSPQWSPTSIRHILTNNAYIGKVKYGERQTRFTVDDLGQVKKVRKQAEGTVADGLHPPIIDKQTFDRVQEVLGNAPRQPLNKQLVNPFATLVKCGVCGYSVIMQNNPKCSPRMTCTHQYQCHNHSILYEEFVDEVIKQLKSFLVDFSVSVNDNTQQTEDTLIQAVKNDLLTIEQKQIKLCDLLEDGTYTKELFNRRNEKYNKEKKRLETTLAELENKKQKQEHFAEFECSLYEVIDSLKDNSISAESKNRLLKGILKKIEYTQTDGNPIISLYI